jgi:hypothetical protein
MGDKLVTEAGQKLYGMNVTLTIKVIRGEYCSQE